MHCLCTVCMPGTCGKQTRSLDALELELWLVMSMCMLGVKLQSSGRKTSAFNR